MTLSDLVCELPEVLDSLYELAFHPPESPASHEQDTFLDGKGAFWRFNEPPSRRF